MMLTHILSFVIFPIAILLKIKIEERDDVLNKEDSDSLKGIAALFIVFAHFYNFLLEFTGVGLGKLWLNMGGIGVCIFFFLSGYGLNRSMSVERPGFVSKRLKSVFVPFLIIRIICFFINYSIGSKGLFFFLGYILGIYEPLWFITVILLIYLGYYVVYKVLGKKYLNHVVFLYNVALGILFWSMGLHERWYNAHLLFSVGMIVATYNEKIINFLKKMKWWLVNAVLGVAFLAFSLTFIACKGTLFGIVLKIMSGICICLLFYNIFLYICIKSPLIQWIGRNSLLIYIIHLQILAMPFMKNVIPSDLCLMVGLAITFVAISLYNMLQSGIKETNF